MNEELKQQHSADAEELQVLIEDAAKLLGYEIYAYELGTNVAMLKTGDYEQRFDPLDPERGDLMKVADAAELVIGCGRVRSALEVIDYPRGDHQSLVLAVLRAASAVWKARGGE